MGHCDFSVNNNNNYYTKPSYNFLDVFIISITYPSLSHTVHLTGNGKIYQGLEHRFPIPTFLEYILD